MKHLILNIVSKTNFPYLFRGVLEWSVDVDIPTARIILAISVHQNNSQCANIRHWMGLGVCVYVQSEKSLLESPRTALFLFLFYLFWVWFWLASQHAHPWYLNV